jgi:hypothetical protein
MPSDFSLIFRYGVGAKNVLDTFNGTYTRDMVIDPPVTVNLSLSNEELQNIYQKMIEISFFSYPENVPPRPNLTVYPHQDYYVKVQCDSKTKEVSWSYESMFEQDFGDGLTQLVNCITHTIESREEYRKLPTPNAGYI